MRARRIRHWVFPGPVPLVARFRFSVSSSTPRFLPGSSMLWHSVPDGLRPSLQEGPFSLVEGFVRCPSCRGIHVTLSLAYRGRAGPPRSPARHWPDLRMLGLLCEVSKADSAPGDEQISFDPARARLEDLCNAWRRCRARGKEVVLYAGAGVSSGSGVPTARGIRSRLGVTPASADGIRRGLEDPLLLFDVIADLVHSVDGNGTLPGRCHHLVKALWQTRTVDWVLTTNGDRLLEETGVDVVRVFDHKEVRDWNRALEGRGSFGGPYEGFARHLRQGRIGLLISVGASRWVGRELGMEFGNRLLDAGTELFQVNPEKPVAVPGSRWVVLSGESAMAGFLRATRGVAAVQEGSRASTRE